MNDLVGVGRVVLIWAGARDVVVMVGVGVTWIALGASSQLVATGGDGVVVTGALAEDGGT